MDTEGPISVLDRRPRASSRDRVITDRVTRQRSPGPAFRHQRGRGASQNSLNTEEDPQDVIYRISQPYRTSFSAKHSVTWGKADRSRSLSPTTSLRSNISVGSAPPIFPSYGGDYRRRPRGRSKSPKRVTYDERVTVRHSDTEDSVFTELSSHEYEDDTPMRPIISPFSRSLISPRYNEFSQLSPVSHTSTLKTTPRSRDQRQKVRDVTNIRHGSGSTTVGDISKDSGLDYSVELKDLSDQITTMQWSPRQNRAVRMRPPPVSSPTHQPHYRHTPAPTVTTASSSAPSPPGILKDSQNSRSGRGDSQTGVISSGNGVVNEVVSFSGRSSSRSSPSSSGPPSRTSPARNNKDKENDPTASPTKVDISDSPPLPDIIHRDYEHDRPFSFSKAVKGEYGEDIQKMAKEGLAEAQLQQRQQQLEQQQQHQQYQDQNRPSGETAPKNGGLNIKNGKENSVSGNKKPPPQSGDEITSSSPTDTSQGESSPGRGSPVESGRLTPSKRSVSLSITNFLKRISPHLRRKRSKDRGSKSSSGAGSAQSLNNTSDGDTDRDSPTSADGQKTKRSGRFSRSQVRNSFMKLVGRPSSRSKKKNKKDIDDGTMPTPAHYTIELQDPERNTSSDEVDEISNGFILNSRENLANGNGKSNFDATKNRLMKSIEQNKVAEQDIYRRFKDRHSPRGTEPSALTTAPSLITTSQAASSLAKPQPIWPTGNTTTSNTPTSRYETNVSPGHKTSAALIDSPMEFFTETDINAILRPNLDKSNQRTRHSENFDNLDGSGAQRYYPPTSLDVMPPRTVKILQMSVMSSISGDESIGDCSLDANLTASEPSLISGISQLGGSKKVVIPQSLVNSAEGQLPTETDSVKLRRPNLKEGSSNKENNSPQIYSPPKSRSDPPSPVDPSHKPSYLKLSCAVSGYGKYSRYSTYKDVNKRSPYSSQSSLRSDGSSPGPNMPAARNSSDESTPEHKNRPSPGIWSKSPTTAVTNGHTPKYPTGDSAKDGEYFLQHTHFEEDRIQGLCLRAEAHMRSHGLPEEACGRIRAAIGKANLLLTKKFVQFKELCQNHMQPDPEERETKWGDLQGFWDIVKIQIDNVDDMFAEIELMKQNGWQEIPRQASRRSSASSSPKSGNVSQASTPSATPGHTPGSKRKNIKPNSSKDTPDSSPERTQKARQAAKARDEARKKLLAERRAAMKQAAASTDNGDAEVEIFLPDPPKKS